MKTALILFLIVFSSICKPAELNYTANFNTAIETALEKEVLTTWVTEHTLGKVKKEEANKIIGLIYKTSNKTNIDPLLVIAMISKESMFKRKAGSNYGAKGLMQVVPRWHHDKIKKRNIYDSAVNIEVGVKVLTDCLNKRNGNINKALSCYSGNAKKYQSYIKRQHKILSRFLMEEKFKREVPISRMFTYQKPIISNTPIYMDEGIIVASK